MLQIREGDCLDVMRRLALSGVRVDALVSDTPYHLTSIVKRFGGKNSAAAKGGDGSFSRLSRGFMGREWDGGDIAQNVEVWRAAYRLLKPGGWLLAMSATRTQHRMVCAIEDAGFEIRDLIGWMYGQGFSKNRRIMGRWSVGLKPAWEPICVARKPLGEKTVEANLLRWGVGALNIGDCRVEATGESRARVDEASADRRYADRGSTNFAMLPGVRGGDPEGRFPSNIIVDDSDAVRALFPGETARFFYCAKATADERAFDHPTVKPTALMRYLVRLVTVPGATVLDPFAGTGQTGHAALLEGRRAILIEKEPDYAEGLRRRFQTPAARRMIVL